MSHAPDPAPSPAPVVVHTAAWCPYCSSAKRLLAKLDIPFDEVDLERDPALRERLSAQHGGYSTVPMILVEGRFIGGYDDLARLARSGALQHLRRGTH